LKITAQVLIACSGLWSARLRGGWRKWVRWPGAAWFYRPGCDLPRVVRPNAPKASKRVVSHR